MARFPNKNEDIPLRANGIGNVLIHRAPWLNLSAEPRDDMICWRGRLVRAASSVLSSWVLLVCLPASGQNLDPIPIRDGQTLSATQRADEAFAYVFEAAADKTYLLELEQDGLDFVLTVETRDGSKKTYSSPLRRDEREYVVLGPATAGTEYRITVSSDEFTGAKGTHSLRVSALDADGARFRALRSMTEGAFNALAGGSEGTERAIAAYEDARGIWAGLDDARMLAYTTFAVAMLEYWETKDREKSAELAGAAAEIYSTLVEPVVCANAMHLEAASLIEIAEESDDPASVYTRALDLFAQARDLQAAHGRNYERAHSINNMGLTYYYMGDWARAREYWQAAAPIFRNSDEWSGELFPLANIGVVDAEEGYLTTAAAALRRTLEIFPEGRNLRHRVDTLANLAGVERLLGNFDTALDRFTEALAVASELEDVYGEGWALFGLGETYLNMGDTDLAKHFLEQSLPKERAAGDSRGEAAVLRYLGIVEQLAGNDESALRHHRAALELATSPPDRALVLLLLSRDYSQLGRASEATEMAAQALAIAEESGSALLIADALEQSGRAELAGGDAVSAERLFEDALALYDETRMPAGQARASNGLSMAAAALGALPRAIEYGNASLAHIERLRNRVGDPDLRAFFLSREGRSYYEHQISLLMDRGEALPAGGNEYLFEALSTAERSRARVLVELLQSRKDHTASPGSEYDVARRRLLDRLAEARVRRAKLLDVASPSAAQERELRSASNDLAAVENELNLLESRAGRRNQGSGLALPPQTLSAREIQAALDDDTTLLQYALGEVESFVWVVTNDDIRAARLPGRGAIESAARAAFESLRGYRASNSHRQQQTALISELSSQVIGPIEPMLDRERLLVAPDGALEYIPFAILSVPGSDGAMHRLVDSFEVVNVPSMSVLANLRERERRAPSKQVAIFADPVFGPTDPRLADVGSSALVANVDAPAIRTRESRRMDNDLPRLPQTGTEALAIGGLVPSRQRFMATGFDATREAVLDTDLSDFRIVHFATHGLIDARYPDLSALVMSRVDRNGTPHDGLLELSDIAKLDLNSDLIVLSACETALGREVRGEGLIGMVQAFLDAGARAVVATTWTVPDRATSDLMTRFYDYMVNDGASPANALRRAQREIASERRYRDPFFWGAFTLIGDWRQQQ